MSQSSDSKPNWMMSFLPRAAMSSPSLAVALGAAFILLVPSARAQKPSSQLRSKTTTVAAVAAPAIPVIEQSPAIAPAPREAPPSVPQVTWDGSQLTIITDNSTLWDILAAVRAHTGADIEMPEGASNQRMAARLGPGPVREVLSSLLSWTGFNYVIQASEKDPDEIKTIMLTPRPKDDVEVAAGSPRPLRGTGYRPPVEPAPPEAADLPELQPSAQTSLAAGGTTPNEPAGQPSPVSAGADSPTTVADLQPSTVSETAAATTGSNSSPNQPKTQMIEQLQSMYQKRLQLQESQKPRSEQAP